MHRRDPAHASRLSDYERWYIAQMRACRPCAGHGSFCEHCIALNLHLLARLSDSRGNLKPFAVCGEICFCFFLVLHFFFLCSFVCFVLYIHFLCRCFSSIFPCFSVFLFFSCFYYCCFSLLSLLLLFVVVWLQLCIAQILHVQAKREDKSDDRHLFTFLID